jgi:RNA polymerase sigma-70 factor (sigma-E family)
VRVPGRSAWWNFSGKAEQRAGTSRVLSGVDCDDPAAGAVARVGAPVRSQRDVGSAEEAVGALYETSALSLIRMAYVMLDDLPGAEDVVQEAFCGLYRRWDRLQDRDGALYYVRASVLNGCRSVLRRRAVRRKVLLASQPPAVSAAAVVLSGEERGEVIVALGRLPRRQREVLVLRFYLDLSDGQIARVMGIAQSTVRSTAHRALHALGRTLEETS